MRRFCPITRWHHVLVTLLSLNLFQPPDNHFKSVFLCMSALFCNVVSMSCFEGEIVKGRLAKMCQSNNWACFCGATFASPGKGMTSSSRAKTCHLTVAGFRLRSGVVLRCENTLNGYFGVFSRGDLSHFRHQIMQVRHGINQPPYFLWQDRLLNLRTFYFIAYWFIYMYYQKC